MQVKNEQLPDGWGLRFLTLSEGHGSVGQGFSPDLRSNRAEINPKSICHPERSATGREQSERGRERAAEGPRFCFSKIK